MSSSSSNATNATNATDSTNLTNPAPSETPLRVPRLTRVERLRASLANTWPVTVLVIVLLAVWEVVIRALHVPNFVVPAPSEIVTALVLKQQDLALGAWVTAKEVFDGFVISSIVGAACALLIVRFERFGQALYPLMVMFQNVPKIALAPLFILWFGYDLQPKIILIVVMAFFPVALNMLVGLRSADPNLIALLRSVGASRTEIMMRVQIPNSLPALMAGIKVAITLSVIGAIVGEFAGASAGLGYMIQFASTQMQTSLVFAALVEVSVLGVIFYYAVEVFEHHFITWSAASGH
jgi:NitT/TauT family transport system permease protein